MKGIKGIKKKGSLNRGGYDIRRSTGSLFEDHPTRYTSEYLVPYCLVSPWVLK